MKGIRIFAAAVFLLSVAPALAQSRQTVEDALAAFAKSGHTVWGEWTFVWEIKDQAGLALRDVKFKNELVARKMSLPVIRVLYDYTSGVGCGPYADQINNVQRIVNEPDAPFDLYTTYLRGSRCGGKRVCQVSYRAGGRNWIEVAVYARIAAYHIYQAWYLSHDGWIGARVWSRGLACNATHAHHPYWRMDLDVKDDWNDQIFVYDNNRPNEGWGDGWHKYTDEFNEYKNPATARVWFVRDHPGGHGVWVLPSRDDGNSSSFSDLDVAGRRYNPNEDVGWIDTEGEADLDHLTYGDSADEDIQEKDVVLWYVCHLHHEAREGADLWHSCGPWLFVAREDSPEVDLPDIPDRQE